MPEQKEEASRVGRMEKWLRNQPILSIVILLGIIFNGAAEVIHNGSEIWDVITGKNEKILKLAADNAKGEFSRRFTELAWRRIFWSNNYLERVKLKRPSSELDYSWTKHLDTLADWSADYMVNLEGMAKYYPSTDKVNKAQQFEAIHDSLHDLDTCRLVPLRRVDSDGKDHVSETMEAAALVDRINTSLYLLVLNRPGLKEPEWNEGNPIPVVSHCEICPRDEQCKDNSQQ